MLLFLGLETRVQTLFLVNWWSSSSMAIIWSSVVKAYSVVLGSISDTRVHEARSLNDDLVLTPSVLSPILWSCGWWWTNFQLFIYGLWSEDSSIWGRISSNCIISFSLGDTNNPICISIKSSSRSYNFLSNVSPSLNLSWMDYSTTKVLVLKTL